ncbi:hypothetical protein ANO11243_013360 [Dothideomycetidae sp. 11243]|nr:hypothetical protein ANO11243_013360 [fungal sp. No.11243]
MFTPREILDIIELIFYVPVLFVAGYVCLKHGFQRSAGYLFLVILALLRLIGASTGIASAHNPDNTDLLTTTIICSSVGLSPLLLTLIGFTQRIHNNASGNPPIPPRFLRLVSIPIIAALILSIVAGTDSFSSKPSDRSTAHTYAKAASLLYLVSLVLIAGILALTLATRARLQKTDTKLLYAGLVALPFLAIRVLFSILTAFDYKDSATFSVITDTTRAVVVQAIMSVLMEFIVVVVYLVAAIATPRLAPRDGGNYPETRFDLGSEGGRHSARRYEQEQA